MTTSPPRKKGTQHPADRGATASASHGAVAPSARVGVKKLFGGETSNYFLLLGTTLFLIVFGLVMVLSSSSVTSFTESGQFFGVFERQALFAGIGLPLMLIASRLPPLFWKRWAGIAVIIAVVLQFLTVATPLGTSVNGNRNWIELGELRFQPSELMKLALVVWLALILAKKLQVIGNWKELAIPVVPVTGVAVGLVVLGGDLGTTLILVAMILGAVFFAGARLKHLAVTVVVLAAGIFVVMMSSASRRARIDVWLSGCSNDDDYADRCWQTLHGFWALASGGIFGVGLGNSKAKWNWLPESDNDFIFAIIGEELGMLGAVLILILFIVMAIAFVRIVRVNSDPFARIAVATIMVWLIGQAFVNIAVVLGMLPVLGVPLPFISSGGTALISSMLAVGMALSFARKPVGSAPR